MFLDLDIFPIFQGGPRQGRLHPRPDGAGGGDAGVDDEAAGEGLQQQGDGGHRHEQDELEVARHLHAAAEHRVEGGPLQRDGLQVPPGRPGGVGAAEEDQGRGAEAQRGHQHQQGVA